MKNHDVNACKLAMNPGSDLDSLSVLDTPEKSLCMLMQR